MLAKILDCEQGTPEWFEARLGIPTASNFHKVLSKGRGATRKAYMIQLAAERLTGTKAESFQSEAMKRGNEIEPKARAAYEFDKGITCELVGFYTNGQYGCSPDALIGDNGLLEIKSPLSTTHIETVLSGKMPPKHIAQVQGQMWITERDWCDFVSFDPRINTTADYFCVRVDRDDEYIENLATEIDTFNNELNKLLERLK